MNQLKTFSPSAIDLEIRALSFDNNFEDLHLILRFILNQLQSKQNFDIIQAVLHIFLNIHMEIIIINEEIMAQCEEVEKIQEKTWMDLEDQINNTLCLLSYFTNTFDQL